VSDASQTNYVFDTTAPVLVKIGRASCRESITQVGFAVTPAFSDNCSTNLTVSVLSTVTNGTACAATVVRTWRADDGCGNAADASQTNYLFPYTALFRSSVPGPLTNQCITQVSFAVTPAFSDNCSTNLTVSVLSTVTN